MNEEPPLASTSDIIKNSFFGKKFDHGTFAYKEEPLNTFLEAKALKKIQLTDGSYSWIVMMALLASNILTMGFNRAFGIMNNAIQDTYYDTVSDTVAGVILGSFAACRCVFAPVSGVIINNFGVRTSIFLGSFFCFFGLFGSSLLSSGPPLIFTLGMMTGTGVCFIETAQVIIIADYFKKHLALANGLRACGEPIGGMVYPLLIVILLGQYGLKMSFLLLSAIMAHTMIFGMILQPFGIHKEMYLKKIVHKLRSSQMLTRIQCKAIFIQLKDHFRTPGEIHEKNHLEFGVFRDLVYLTYLVITIAVSFGVPIVTYYIPIHGKEIGLTPLDNSFVLFIHSICDMACRLFLGCIINTKLVRVQYSISACLIVGGAAAASLPLTINLYQMVANVFFLAFATGSFLAFINVALCEDFDRRIISTTWSFVHLIGGAVNFMVLYMLGYISDRTGSHSLPFHVMGCGMIVGGVLIAVIPSLKRIITKSYIPL